MANRVPMEEMYPLIEEMLNKNGTVSITVVGQSMQPMLYNLRDTVTLIKPAGPLKKYDLPFFRTDEGKFILHRVIKINHDKSYECRGDNCWKSENNIRDEQIIGIVKSFVRDGKTIFVDRSVGYWFYSRTWKFFHPFKKYHKYYVMIKNKLKF